MSIYEPIGYLASLLVLATFCMRDMVSLRVVAIASNVAFVGYAALLGINPVLFLHAVLLPVNAYRLVQAMQDRRRCAALGCDVSATPASTPAAAGTCAQGGASRRSFGTSRNH